MGNDMQPRTLIDNLEFIVTVNENDEVIRNGALLLEEDRIRAIGASEKVKADNSIQPCDRIIDARGFGATPGFVDTHVHLSETLSRAAFPDTLSTRAWVFHWVMPYYGHMTKDDERISVILGAVELLSAGTTCFLDMGALKDPAVTIPAIASIGIRGITGRHAADVKPKE